ncbi:unnamed protein product [Closterium sp. NIES-53]
MDTLQARLDDVRARHAAGDYGGAEVEVLLLGIRAQWARENPTTRTEVDGAPASPQPVHNEGVVADQVDGGDQVGSGGSTRMTRGVIRAADVGVGIVQARVQRLAAARSSNADSRHRSPQQSGVKPTSATHVSAGRDRGIALAYGYFKKLSDKIDVPKLLEGRHDLITWIESIETQPEITGLKKFVDGNVETLDKDDSELWSEFRAAHRLTFMVILRCCLLLVQVALKPCRLRVDASYQAWQYIMRTYKAIDDLYISQLEKKLTNIRMEEQESATKYCNRARRVLANLQMACVDYSVVSYVTHDKQASKTSSTKDADSSGGNACGETASCSIVGVVEPAISLVLEAGEDFKAVTDAVQANPTVVLLDYGYSHHLMGTEEAFVKMQPSDDVRHVRGFNEALQSIRAEAPSLCKGRSGSRSSSPTCSTFRTSTEVVALRTIAFATKSTPDMWHARLAHAGVNTIKSSAKHEVAAGLDMKKLTADDLLCASYVGSKIAWHTFPDQGSDAENALDVPVAKKSNVLVVFEKWLKVVERQTSKTVKMLYSDRGGEFLDRAFTDLIEDKGILHNLTCPYTPQQNDMAEREMRTTNDTWLCDRPCGTPSTPPTDSSSVHPPLLVADDKLDEDDANNVTPSLPPPVQWSSSATGDEERLGTSPAAPTSCIAGVQRDTEKVSDGKRQTTGESSTLKKTAETPSAEAPTVEKLSAEAPTSREPSAEELLTREQLDDDSSSNVVEVVGASGGDEGETLIGEQSDNSDVVEVAVKEAKLQDDIDLPELDPDMHANPEHRWDIANMTVKEALASWKGKAVKAAMDEGTRSLISNGTWELVERPRRVNIMKNRWVLMMKYHVDDTVAREKDRLIVKGFMQLDMKKAFMQSKLDRVLYMYQPDYYNDGTGRVCKLLKSLYGLKQTLLLWYKALNDELSGADWKKSQVDEALNFKVGDDGVAGWVLMYVDDLLAASSSTAMLKELKVLLEVAFELCEISPVEKYLVLEIVRDRSARNLWLPQQVYVDNLRRRFINEEQTGRVPKTPISVDAYAELKFDNEEF